MARIPSAVLRNKGVPVDVLALDGGEAILDDHDNPRIEKAWVRFDANAMADLEEAFGSLDAFDAVLLRTPTGAIRRALAAAWDCTSRDAGSKMLIGHQDEYATAIAVAMALANGVDPQQASDLLESGVTATAEAKNKRTRIVAKLIAEGEAESRGTNGSGPGSEPDDSATSSGEVALLRSTS